MGLRDKVAIGLVAAAVASCTAEQTPVAIPATKKVAPLNTYYPANYEEILLQQKPHFRQEKYRGIIITGTSEFLGQRKIALDIVFYNDQESWKTVEYVELITKNNHPGIDVINGRVTTGPNAPTNPVDIAGRLVHEGCHRERAEKKQKYVDKEAERACMNAENKFYAIVGAPRIDVEEMLKEKFWEVPFEQRDW